jgi:hypothetical protein
MNGQEAIDRLKFRMSRFGSSTALDADILAELKLAQTRLETDPVLPWSLLTELAAITLTAGESRIIVPADMIREYDGGSLEVLDAEGKEHPIKKGIWENIRYDSRYATNALPKKYATVGGYFRLRPIPNAAYVLKMIYWKEDAVITVGAENNWLKYHPDLVIAEAGQVIATGLKNEAAVKMFVNTAAAERTRLLIANEAREHANMEYVGED